MEAIEIIFIIFTTMEILAWCWVSEAAQKATEVLGRHTCHLKQAAATHTSAFAPGVCRESPDEPSVTAI